MSADPDLHGVVEKLVLELLDREDLLEQVKELLLRHDLVAQHRRGGSLAWPTGVLVWNKTYDRAVETSGSYFIYMQC